MPLRLAVATEDFGTPLRTAIAQAASCAGVEGLRLNARSEVHAEDFSDTALRQLRHFVTERQLKVAGLMFTSRHALYDDQQMERRLEGIRAAMTMVRKLGTSELLIRCGRIPDPEGQSADAGKSAAVPDNADVNSLLNPFSFAPTLSPRSAAANQPASAEQFALLCDILDDLVRYGNHIGCVLQLQLASFEISRIHCLLNQVKSGPLGIVFDPATAVMTGGSPVSLFRDLYRYVGYIRGRDALADIDGAGIEVAVGDGAVDWTELLPTISEAEYDGWLCVERTGGEQRADDVCLGVRGIIGLLTPFV